jgi:hypothetical protein
MSENINDEVMQTLDRARKNQDCDLYEKAIRLVRKQYHELKEKMNSDHAAALRQARVDMAGRIIKVVCEHCPYSLIDGKCDGIEEECVRVPAIRAEAEKE